MSVSLTAAAMHRDGHHASTCRAAAYRARVIPCCGAVSAAEAPPRTPAPCLCLQDKVGSRTMEGRRLRQHVLRGAVIVFITAGYSGKRFIFEKVGPRVDQNTGLLQWGASKVILPPCRHACLSQLMLSPAMIAEKCPSTIVVTDHFDDLSQLHIVHRHHWRPFALQGAGHVAFWAWLSCFLFFLGSAT